MYRTPLRRRIIPWLYVAAFIVLAPVLVFYTAGYRYNIKKAQIERNGTLIVDSTPNGAAVSIDDKSTGNKTPVTFQNIVPGWHHIRVDKDGYQSWDKWLEVRPELVTFANAIWLWKAQPATELALPGRFTAVSADPSRGKLALFSASTSTTSLAYWIPGQTELVSQTLAGYPANVIPVVRWRKDGQAILVNGLSSHSAGWWSYASNQSTSVQTPLPAAAFHWTGNEVVGSDAQHTYRIDPRTQAYTQESVPASTVDASDNLTLQTNPRSATLVLSDRSFLTKLFELPAGVWRFGDFESTSILLTDGERWLCVDPKADPPTQGILTGDVPRWLNRSSRPRALFVNRNEVWSWDLGSNPTLLWRQSGTVVQARWHRGGTSVFIATPEQIFALDLDDRSGRTTTQIAAFDRINDFDLLGNTLYVAGTRQGQEGLWSVAVE